MKNLSTLSGLALLAGLALAAPAPAATPASAPAAAAVAPAASPLVTHYEAIRVALLHDTMKDVATHATALAAAARAEAGPVKPAPVPKAATSQPAANPLTDLAAAADRLAGAKDLAAARKAYAPVSKAVIAWHAARAKDGNVVVYCPMVKESWLQPKGEIGNPYYGQSMAKCGEIVSK